MGRPGIGIVKNVRTVHHGRPTRFAFLGQLVKESLTRKDIQINLKGRNNLIMMRTFLRCPSEQFVHAPIQIDTEDAH